MVASNRGRRWAARRAARTGSGRWSEVCEGRFEWEEGGTEMGKRDERNGEEGGPEMGKREERKWGRKWGVYLLRETN